MIKLPPFFAYVDALIPLPEEIRNKLDQMDNGYLSHDSVVRDMPHGGVVITKSPYDRFMSKLKYNTNTGCIIFQAAKEKGGYKRMRIRTGSGGKEHAHRISYSTFKGEIPETNEHGEKIEVMHICDVPDCVNPDHLKLGTHLDNMQDMFKKNRREERCGTDHQNSKFSEEDIITIKRLLSEGDYMIKEIAEYFKVHRMTITRIRNGESYKEVA